MSPQSPAAVHTSTAADQSPPASGPHPARGEGAVVITAHGNPKPKGSLKHIGNGRLVEQVEGSGTWRGKVADAGRKAMIGAHNGPRLMRRPPLDGPLAVEITVTVAKPKSAPKRRETWPDTRASGDADKLARNILDALADGGVLADDARVIELLCRKRYPGQHPDTLDEPGAVVRVWRIGGDQ